MLPKLVHLHLIVVCAVMEAKMKAERVTTARNANLINLTLASNGSGRKKQRMRRDLEFGVDTIRVE